MLDRSVRAFGANDRSCGRHGVIMAPRVFSAGRVMDFQFKRLFERMFIIRPPAERKATVTVLP
jgi:hypothetical protein